MVEAARKPGPFDDHPGGERLEWSAFLARFFPNRGRHDFAALAAYEAYRDTLDLEAPHQQQQPTMRRTPPGRRGGGSRSRPAAAVGSVRVPVAASSAAVLTWESEGGASAERPAG